VSSAVVNFAEGSQKKLATLWFSCCCVSAALFDGSEEKVVDVPPLQAGALRQETSVSVRFLNCSEYIDRSCSLDNIWDSIGQSNSLVNHTGRFTYDFHTAYGQRRR
jgi:hypothetical protein